MFKINKKTAIKLHPVDEREFTSINDLLSNFYRFTSGTSVYGSNALATVFVSNNTMHCSPNRLRSPRDLAILIKYYFPNENYRTILKEIVTFGWYNPHRNMISVLKTRACSDIQAPNIQVNSYHTGTTLEQFIRGMKFHNLDYKGTQSYSWSKIFEYIGMTEDEVITEQFNKVKKLINPNI